MLSNKLRLNVGQVEVLVLDSDGGMFLFQEPLELDADHNFEVNIGQEPVFPAVPIPSGTCFIPASELSSLPTAVRKAHNAYIQAAASYKHVSPFKKSFSPAVLECLEGMLGESLPRPSYFGIEMAQQQVNPLPDEIDVSTPIREGAKYQVTVNAYERNPRARRLCIEKYGANCFICGFSFGKAYGKLVEGFIHVHHLRPLAEIGEEYEVDPVADLRPVCPNCHAVIHRRVPPYSIEELKSFLQQTGSS
jgi:5-methylcytosine-specific restriction protein A